MTERTDRKNGYLVQDTSRQAVPLILQKPNLSTPCVICVIEFLRKAVRYLLTTQGPSGIAFGDPLSDFNCHRSPQI